MTARDSWAVERVDACERIPLLAWRQAHQRLSTAKVVFLIVLGNLGSASDKWVCVFGHGIPAAPFSAVNEYAIIAFVKGAIVWIGRLLWLGEKNERLGSVGLVNTDWASNVENADHGG
jgi:hypothetical protein